ncbi:hypothetical protein TRIP_C60190 [Candidatus Zixiibacteriota bacterium]|nr:hypothetical protein TRIP_C60190 [candidate division Zixibacteria bacterium]
MKRSFVIISALLMGLYFLGGCSKDIKGPPRDNIPPLVDFVNIPVEGARFSSDTAIYWYGTDVDGFIRYFRYAVIESTVVGADPQAYAQNSADSLIPWVVVSVSLEDPGTKQTIKMSADVRDPVRKYIASYIFLQAVDNLGAKSVIVNRLFRKNNHFPDTRISANELKSPYVNAVTSTGVLDGVSLAFSGDDPIDYPRNPPPFEYHWKVFGPYDSLNMVQIRNNYTESVFVDIYGDFYKLHDFYKTVRSLDTTIDTTVVPPDTTIDTTFNYILVDTLRTGNPYGNWGRMLKVDSLPPGLNHLVEESYNPLNGSFWVTSTSANIYDVFKGYPADTTRQEYFLVWAQCRDDSKVPDPVPPFTFISVIDPKFERDVMLYDMTRYGGTSDFNYPAYTSLKNTTVKDIYGRFINAWKPGSFDTLNILKKDSIQISQIPVIWGIIDYPKWKCTQDYYAAGAPKTAEAPAFKLRDVLKHKIIILVKDSPSRLMNITSTEGLAVIEGLSAGMSAWVMARSPFVSDVQSISPVRTAAPTTYRQFFGIDQVVTTGWVNLIKYFCTGTPEQCPFGLLAQIRIEDFIAAIPEKASLESQYPTLRTDTTLLGTRYYWNPGYGILACPYRCSDSSIIIGALPEVGYVEKVAAAEPLYLYHSLHGNDQPRIDPGCDGVWVGHTANFEGAVTAVRYIEPSAGLFRTSHFCFSMLPFDSTSAQTVVNTSLDWLSVQPYIGAGKMAPMAPHGSFNELRQTLRDLQEQQRKGLLPASMSGE